MVKESERDDSENCISDDCIQTLKWLSMPCLDLAWCLAILFTSKRFSYDYQIGSKSNQYKSKFEFPDHMRYIDLNSSFSSLGMIALFFQVIGLTLCSISGNHIRRRFSLCFPMSRLIWYVFLAIWSFTQTNVIFDEKLPKIIKGDPGYENPSLQLKVLWWLNVVPGSVVIILVVLAVPYYLCRLQQDKKRNSLEPEPTKHADMESSQHQSEISLEQSDQASRVKKLASETRAQQIKEKAEEKAARIKAQEVAAHAAAIKAKADAEADKIKRKELNEFVNSCNLGFLSSEEKNEIVQQFVSKKITTVHIIKTLDINDLKTDLGIQLGAAKAIEERILELKNQTAGNNNGGDALEASGMPAVSSFGATGNTQTQFGSQNMPTVKEDQAEQ